MLPNEEFALACRAYYEEQGLIVDKTNGEFAHCPLPRGMGETGYYLLWEHHQQQGLLQSRDVGRRCFWTGYAKQWLQQCDYWPDNYFDLWDIYDEFSKDLGFLKSYHTPETHRKRSQALKESYRLRSKESIRSQVANAISATSKSVELSFPDGTKEVFPSVNAAARHLHTCAEVVSNWARNGVKPRFRKFKGYSARFV